jgi:hypothetical protein
MGAPGSGILTSNSGSIDSDSNEFISLDVHDNGTTDFDHGLYLATSNNLIDHSTIHHNAGWGVHIFEEGCSNCASNNIVRNNLIHENAAAGKRGWGIILSSGSGNLAYNNLVWGNNGGIQVEYGVSGAKVFNNVLYSNDGYGIYVGPGSVGAIIQNNIVYKNSGVAIQDSGFNTTIGHNLVDVDPDFVDGTAHDFHLQPDSPAIDAGLRLSDVPDDRDGVTRPRGAGHDIGAYESRYSTVVNDLLVVDAISDTLTLTATLRWTAPVKAITYTLRSSHRFITEAHWNDAVTVAVPFTASEAGTTEWLTTPVDYSDTVYLALKWQNRLGAWSELSNNAFWPHSEVYLPDLRRRR